MVCRQKQDKRFLTRIVRTTDSGVVVDPSGKQNGRGAYLCSQPQCWDKILNNYRLLSQVLMVEITETQLSEIAAHRPTSD